MTGSEKKTPQKREYKRVNNLPGAGPGRPKGVPNKTTTLLKEAIIKAAEAHGYDGKGGKELIGYCQFLAENEPKAFAGLLGRVLPLQVTGDGEGGLVIEIIKRTYKD